MTPAQRIAATGDWWVQPGVLLARPLSRLPSDAGIPQTRILARDGDRVTWWDGYTDAGSVSEDLADSIPDLSDLATCGIIEAALREEGVQVVEVLSRYDQRLRFALLDELPIEDRPGNYEFGFNSDNRYQTRPEALAAACELAWPEEVGDE